MAQTPPPDVDVLPPTPSTNSPSTFALLMDELLAALPNFRAQLIALGTNCYNNAVDACSNALAANTSAVSAASSATTAAGVVAAAGAIKWVSGTTYAIGDNRYSPIDLQTYRRSTVGAGTIDPSADPSNWGRVLLGPGTGGTTTTGSVTLVANSPAAMTVTPVSPGLYLTLPNATTCTKATSLFSVYNAGDYDYGVKDVSGTQLGWIRPKTGAIIGLTDSSTSAGVWSYYGLEKSGITANWAHGSLSNVSTNQMQRIALDANRTCFLFGETTCYAIVYDASNQSWGNATVIDTGLTSGAYLGVLSTTDQILLAVFGGSTIYSKTLSITGNTIIPHAYVSTSISGTYAAKGQLVAVGGAFAVSYGYGASTSAVRAITISGNTPSIGSEAVIVSTTTTPSHLYVTGSVLRTLVATATLMTATPYAVSGSTLTAGTAATATTSSAIYRSILNGNGNIVAMYANNNTSGSIFKLTGTVEAVSTAVLSSQVFSTLALSDYITVSSSKTAVIVNPGSTALWYANILTDTSGTASAGTAISAMTNGNIVNFASVASVSGSSVRFAYNTASQIAQITMDCSGASPVFNNVQTISYGGSTPVGICQSSDSYGVRSPSNLSAGLVAIFIGSAASVGDTKINQVSIVRQNPLLIAYLSSIGVVGASANESWFCGPILGSVGYTFQRVEVAA
ncbi:MAG: hypothetical protein ACXWFA_18205 [Methylobacter sp.]